MHQNVFHACRASINFPGEHVLAPDPHRVIGREVVIQSAPPLFYTFDFEFNSTLHLFKDSTTSTPITMNNDPSDYTELEVIAMTTLIEESTCQSSMVAITTGVMIAIMVTALLVVSVSVFIHIAVYQFIYKPRMKSKRATEINGDNNQGEGVITTLGGGGAMYDVINTTRTVGKTMEMNENEAYSVPRAGEVELQPNGAD